ncbi:hypothetical protein J2810_002589 [Chryseobacterium rhizosphaerae]|uniref:DUF4238 domain-containing protein n=1 Tax=Chryseobacterium rhizosphaerae TaxID=395937 RepID=UPI0028545AF5|nr:DUF4238 domain-containing protein [Chryseobacterium rhizosphaerae]MDR6546530.1 hypothetical protein [Chryseobacterium rhizosphaerae]
MSIPKNHHYISQIHIKNFFNNGDGGIYLYDKDQNNLFKSKGTRNIFSERNLNTRRISENDIDYISIENELSNIFEKDFNKHLATVRSFCNSLKYSEEVEAALLYFARYGVIGEFRTPHYKRKLDDSMFNGLKDILEHAVDDLKEEFFKEFNFDNEVKYTNTINYEELSNNIIEAMGEMSFILSIPTNKEDYFLLGDFCAVTIYDKINEDFNPHVKEIAYIGFPLCSSIYLELFSNKWNKSPQTSIIRRLGSNHVFSRNKANFMRSRKMVACEDADYLKCFIQQVRKDL